jgi:hypothetical protein
VGRYFKRGVVGEISCDTGGAEGVIMREQAVGMLFLKLI